MSRLPFTSDLLMRLGRQKGLAVCFDEEWGRFGTLCFPDRTPWPFIGANLGLNNSAAYAVCQDKGFSKQLLSQVGIKTPKWRVFASSQLREKFNEGDGAEQAVRWANELGFPVFAKPNNLAYGTLVSKVTASSELRIVANLIFEKTNSMIVEEFFRGRDYRIIILNGKARIAYERIPLEIFGDGISCVRDLIEQKFLLIKQSKQRLFTLDPFDLGIDKALRAQGLHRDSVPHEGHRITLQFNASHNKGAEVVDCWSKIHPDFIDIAQRAANIIGLNFCGVDILTEDISKSLKEVNYGVLELNSDPSLELYYALGSEQKARVEALYSDILDDLHARAK